MGNSGFVFVHGAWHNHTCWEGVISELDRHGYVSKSIDLPGAGGNASEPNSLTARDSHAFAIEPSPNAGVTQEERTVAVVAAIRDVAAQTGGKVILVGHSMGGVTVSPVVEAIADEIAAAVYVTAFLLPPGMPAIAMIQDPVMAEAVVPSLFMADPQSTGALRIDTLSQDAAYRARLREAFYGDLDEASFERAASQLHCDEPAQVALVPSAITADQFGSVPRHYVYCTADRAITIAGQRKMTSMVDGALGSTTTVHTMATSHSPFYSQPAELAEILKGIAELA